jgi:hypothetical protein
MTAHDSKRMKLRERLAVEIPTSHRITTMEVAQLNTQIEKEITRERANRIRHRAFANAVKAGRGK